MNIETTIKNLKNNGFEVYFAQSAKEAGSLFFSDIWPQLNPHSVSFADSMTLQRTGILERLRSNRETTFIDTFDPAKNRTEKMDLRRQALMVDLFLTGTNALTEDGKLINLDMIGNRTNAIAFGPRHVVLTVGVNKIVADLEAGMKRVKTISAPLNAARHDHFTLPCQKTGYCVNCNRPDRICNVWSIIEKSFPKKRIHIILINETIGL